MVGAILGTIGAAGGALWNGIKGGKYDLAIDRSLERSRDENAAWYNYRRREVGSERESARRNLERLREMGRDRAEAAAGRAAVMGGGSAVQRAESAATNKALGDAVSQVNAAQERQRDAAEMEYRRESKALDAQERNLAMAQQQNLSNAVTQGSAIFARAASAIDGLTGSVWDDDKKKKPMRVGGVLPDDYGVTYG